MVKRGWGLVLVPVLSASIKDKHKAPSPHPLFPLSLRANNIYPCKSALAPTDVDADWMNLFIEKWVILHIPRKLFLTYTSENTEHNGAITNSSVGDRA